MEREAIQYLLEWKQREDRKPLVIRGARQTGKTYLVRELLGKKHFRHYIEINFEQHPQFSTLFSSNDPANIIPFMEASTGIPVEDGKTLVFLDEIQAAPKVLASLRYFREQRPGLHVIAAGSLLEFALGELDYSMPVGRVEYMFLGPLSFNEFLCATGRAHLSDFIRHYDIGMEMPMLLHGQLLEQVLQYWLVGGMPEAVETWRKKKSFLEVERVQQSLMLTFMDDFSKYRKSAPLESLQKIFMGMPHQLGNKFMYADIDRNERSRTLGAALTLLEKARLLFRVRRAKGNGLPLEAEADERNFKVFGLDIGLLGRLLGLSISGLTLPVDESFVCNRGGLCEQFTAQMLKAAEPLHSDNGIYYWAREKGSSNAEVDFLIQAGERIVPVEVKAGATGRMKSLHSFLQEKHRDFGIRFNGDLPSYIATEMIDQSGRRFPFRLLSLPFYLVGEWKRLSEKYL